MKRSCGVLLPVFSLPSKYGIGAFSREAYEFVDQLARAGQSFWQILPLGPTSYGDSPYQSFSTFAGNPYFIDLDALIEEGVLLPEECGACDFGDDPSRVDYGKLYRTRFGLLRKAYSRSGIYKDPAFQAFIKNNAYWLDDYALFMAVKACFDGKAWSEWAEDIRLRWGYSLDYYRREYYYEIEFYKYLQFKFMEQWTKLKKYANDRGIRIIGDIPIYVAFDSADAWANPELFQFDENRMPTAVAGCPPDAFSETGQLWGNPLYRWDYHKQTGYAWWTKRMEHSYELYDMVRIDHFRGFESYFAIPYGDKTAEGGHWEPGPGMELFETLTKKLGARDVIAEDLGLITPAVEKLVADSGYPNMRVLEFAFDEKDIGYKNPYLPHNFSNNCVVYTGTHDNDTLVSWYESQPETLKERMRSYYPVEVADADMPHFLLCLTISTAAGLCVIPMQDYLELGGRARINFPSTLGTNWQWRLLPGQVTDAVLDRIYEMNLHYARCAQRKPAGEDEPAVSENPEEEERPDDLPDGGQTEEIMLS